MISSIKRNLDINKDLCNAKIEMKKLKFLTRMNKDIMKNDMKTIIRNNLEIIKIGIKIANTNVRGPEDSCKEVTIIFTIVLEMFIEETSIIDVLNSRAEDNNLVITL